MPNTLPIVVILRDFARGLPDPLPRRLFANDYHQALDKFPWPVILLNSQGLRSLGATSSPDAFPAVIHSALFPSNQLVQFDNGFHNRSTLHLIVG